MKNQLPQDFFKDYDDYCWFSDPKNGSPLMTSQEYQDYVEYMYQAEEHQAEMEAENAWLRKAEEGIDDGFDRWEWERGCYL